VVWSTNVNSRITVVTHNKPKMLIGLDQNGARSAQGLKPSLSWTNDRRRIERTSSTLADKRNTVNPYRSLWEDKPQGKSIAVRVEDEGESERRSVIERIGVEPLAIPLANSPFFATQPY